MPRIMLASDCMLAIIVLAFASYGTSSMAEHWDQELAERRNLAMDIEQQEVLKQEQAYSSCPEGYPAFGTLGDLLSAWNPNDPDVPEGVVVDRLRVLDYNDPAQLKLAKHLRDCEVPFKIKGYQEADAASGKWTDTYLLNKLRSCPRCNVMRSDSNRFMFWHRNPGVAKDKPAWTPPTKVIRKPFQEWLNWTQVADAQKIGPTEVHYYLTSGVTAHSKTPPHTGEFIADDLPFFSTKEENFFIPDVSHQKGIQCRFGARGIIAESHFDHGKNFVLMLRGRKRYLLNPPEACPHLGIIKDRQHPSFRHSEVDWADESDWPEGFAGVPALETVLEAGEFLYIPSFWYHYIVSVGFNVQCNARSGLSMRAAWKETTEKCLGRELPAEVPQSKNSNRDRGPKLKERRKSGFGFPHQKQP